MLLLFVPNDLLHDPVTSPKLIGFLLVIGYLLNSNFELFHKTEIKFFLILFMFPITLLISTFFDSYSFFNNFIGDHVRYNGVLLNLAASFAIILVATSGSINLSKVFKAFLNVTLIIIFVQFIQRIGLDPLGGTDLNFPSLLGNTNFSSAVVATLGIGVLNSNTIFGKYKLILSFLLLSAILISLILFGAYQGLFVLIVGFISYGYFYFAKKFSFNWKIVLAFFALIWFFGIGILYSAIKVPFFTSLLYKSGNYERRLEYWNYAFEMFRSRPIFGTGINGFLDFSQELKTLEAIRNDGALVWIDSAHSVPLHYLATGGIFVFFAYCILIAATSYIGLRILKICDEREFLSNLTLISMWFGFQAQSLVSISQAATIILNSILAGLIWNKYLNLQPNHDKIINTPKQNLTSNMRLINRLIITTLKVFFIGCAIYIFVMQFFLSQNHKNLDTAWLNTNYLVKFYPSDRALEYVANSAISQGKYTDAVYILEEAIKINPKNVRPRYTLGIAHELMGDKIAAEKFIFESFSMNPLNTYFLEQLIRIEVSNGHLDQARVHIDKLRELDPNYSKLSELLNLL